MYKRPEIHEFFVEGNDLKKSHVLLHITEPSNSAEKQKGYFFALTEINKGSIEQIEHLQQMIDDLESGYYETEDEENKTSFELTLEYINRRGHHILKNSQSIIHCAAGVLRDNKLAIAYRGRPTALLYFQTSKGLKILDIMEEYEETDEQEQLFSAVLEGTLKPNDFLYMATPHVDDYFAHERILKILSSRTPRQSTAHLQKVLKDIRGDISFGGIIIKAPEKEEVKNIPNTPIERRDGSEESLKKMVAAEQKTNHLLNSPLLGHVKTKMNSVLPPEKRSSEQDVSNRKVYYSNSMETNYRPRELEIQRQSVLNNILIGLGRAIVILAINLYKTILFCLKFLGKAILAIILLITNKGGHRREIIAELKKDIASRKKFIKNLPIVSKIILILTLVLIAAFTISISYGKIKEKRQIALQRYENTIDQVIEKKDLAEASMLYDDDEKAFRLVKESKQALRDLLNEQDQDDGERIQTIESLRGDIENIFEQLRKINQVQPTLIANLSTVGADAEKIEIIDNSVVAYSEADDWFYKVDIDTGKIEKKEHNTIPQLRAASTPKENDKIVFVSGNSGIAEYNKETMVISEKEISFAADNVKIQDVFVYNRRLYTLIPNQNQVYRHEPTLGGYDRGSPWIKQNIDLSGAVSFAIDGDLYVLKNDGQVIRLGAGIKDDFSLKNIDPPLSEPNKIWTYNSVGSIFILEPVQPRIIRVNKEGKLQAQYTSEKWTNPTGMAVNVEDEEILVLDNQKLYRFQY